LPSRFANSSTPSASRCSRWAWARRSSALATASTSVAFTRVFGRWDLACRRVGLPASRHRGLQSPKSWGIHETGSTSTPLNGALSGSTTTRPASAGRRRFGNWI
jgi:hypothetical protein